MGDGCQCLFRSEMEDSFILDKVVQEEYKELKELLQKYKDDLNALQTFVFAIASKYPDDHFIQRIKRIVLSKAT